jgi:hypothetical protein
VSDDADEIRRDADISQLRSEFAHLDDPMLVEALYRYLEAKRGRRPRLKKARAYIKHVTTNLEPDRIWKRLGRSMPPPEVAPAPRTAAPRRRRAGRPKGTRSATRDQIVEAFGTYRATHHRRPTQVQLAANLKPPIAVRTLQVLLAEYGLPWPIE